MERDTSVIKDRDIRIPITWQVVLICVLAFVGGGLGGYFVHDGYWSAAQGAILFAAAAYAAMVDFRLKLVPDWIHFVIASAALPLLIHAIMLQDWSKLIAMALGMVVVPLPLLLSMFMTKNGIGGADIKIMVAIGLNLGIIGGFISLILGLLLAIIVNGVMIATKKKDKKTSFAFVPYIAIASMAAFFF